MEQADRKVNLIRSISHFIQRGRELGLLETLRRTWMRSQPGLKMWSQSLWWGWKARQKMSDSALLAHTNGDWPTVDALLDNLADRPASSFLLPHESFQETASLLYQFYPEYVSAVLASADAACQNKLSLFGQVFHFPNGIDWHLEPVSGSSLPLWHRSRLVKYEDTPAREADLIFSWEMNRHQHFITLGIAFSLTQDQKYVNAFIAQIQHWMETNPLQHGLNWYESLQVSIRLIAWITAFQFFRTSPVFQKETGRAFLKSLWQQADFLSSHLQTTDNDIPNNHLIGELVGLILVGTIFPEFRDAAAWRDSGLRQLNQEITAQTYVDGVNKEQATGYHRFVTEFLFLIVARSRQGALPVDPILEQTLEHMVDYLLFCLTPPGTPALWGDSDHGRVMGLGQNKEFFDFRPFLSTGAVMFKRPDWKFAAGRFDEESFMLLGTEGLHSWQQLEAHPPGYTSQGFTQAGMYIIRDNWTPESDIAFFRCGPFGWGGEGQCAHAHADLLSFVLWINGRPLLVDSGTYTYHGSWRDHFRLTAAHNTVMVDDQEQAVVLPEFCWENVPEAKCTNWNGTSVTGAMTCSPGVEFARELSHPQPGTWELVDKFTGKDEFHSLSWFFHFAAGLTVYMADNSERVIVEDHGNPFVTIYPPKSVSVEIKKDWGSNCYGKKERIPVLQASWKGEVLSSSISFYWKFLGIK